MGSQKNALQCMHALTCTSDAPYTVQEHPIQRLHCSSFVARLVRECLSVHGLRPPVPITSTRIMSTIAVSERLVVEWQEKNHSNFWIVPEDRVQEVAGSKFITLSYSGDRAFARFCGADMSKSNPLKDFGWLEDAKKLRDVAVNAELDKLASQKLVGHKTGKRLLLETKQQPAESMPRTITVCAPELTTGDTKVDACDLRMLVDVDPRNSVSVVAEPGALSYIKHAMCISKQNADANAALRARPKHVDRLVNATGVLGVHSAGKAASGCQRVVTRYANVEGKKVAKTACLPKDDPDGVTSSVCKRLKKTATLVSPCKAEPAPTADASDDEAPLQALIVEAAADEEVSPPEAPQSELGDVEEPQTFATDPPDAIERAPTAKALAFNKLFGSRASNGAC